MTLITQAPSSSLCGTVVVVQDCGRRERAYVDAVASQLAERLGVDVVAVATRGVLPEVVAGLTRPLICVAATRHGPSPLVPGTDPLLIIGPRCGDYPSPELPGDVLACLDGSRRAETVLPLAVAWAEAFGADLSIVSAVRVDPGVLSYAGTHDLLESSYLARVATTYRPHANAPDWEVLHGDPVEAVIAHARFRRAGVIAVNTHGTSTSDRNRCGRVPSRLLHKAPVPVLLTRNATAPPVEERTPPVAPPSPPVPRRRHAAPRVRPVDPVPLTAAARAYQLVVSPPAPPSRRRTAPPLSRRARLTWAAAGVLLFSLVTTLVRVPYYAVDGGIVRADILLGVDERPAGTGAGSILVPVVQSDTVTALGLLRVWLDPTADARPKPHDREDAAWRQQTARQLMAAAADDAAAVALGYLGQRVADHRVQLHAGDLGGPSAGLAFALQIVDSLSGGTITDGRVVAVTGALDRHGRVHPVGGLRYKEAAAHRAGAAMLIVPAENEATAAAAAPGVRVVGVRTFADAIAALRQRG